VKCFVSGATGFVGRELCRQLADREITFTGLSQRGGQLPDGTATLMVDLNSQEVDIQLLQGVDVVFHLAGIAHQQAPLSAYTQINQLATLALAKASAEAGVKCFVYLSSVKAMGAPNDATVRSEEQGTPPGSAYGLSKLQAERGLRDTFAHSEMSVVILRPSLVYGPGVRGNLLSMGRAVRAGVPRPPEMGGRSMVAVQDLARLMLQIAEKPPPGIHTWIVCDGLRYSARQIHDLMREALGKRPGLSWLPHWGWRFAAFLADGLRDRGADSTYHKLFGTEFYSSAALLRDTPWQPQFELADTMPAIMADPEENMQ
jgi:nucleoside-diphosphate-sugar epimerase